MAGVSVYINAMFTLEGRRSYFITLDAVYIFSRAALLACWEHALLIIIIHCSLWCSVRILPHIFACPWCMFHVGWEFFIQFSFCREYGDATPWRITLRKYTLMLYITRSRRMKKEQSSNKTKSPNTWSKQVAEIPGGRAIFGQLTIKMSHYRCFNAPDHVNN